MNLPDILNVAIGLIVLYFLLSTVASAVAELFAQLLRYREELLIVTVNRLLTGLDDVPWSKRRLLWSRALEGLARVVPGAAMKSWIHARRPGPTPLPPVPGDPDATLVHEVFVHAFWRHAKIANLAPEAAEAPAWIEPSTFAQVVADLAVPRDSSGALPHVRVALERRLSGRQPRPVVTAGETGSAPTTSANGSAGALDVDAAITRGYMTADGRPTRAPEALRATLRTLGLSSTIPADAAGETLWSLFEGNVATWFKEAMAMATDRYRQLMRRWLTWLGLLLAVVLNADTIRVVYVLAHDKDLAGRVAAYAETITVRPEDVVEADRAGLEEQKRVLRESLQDVQMLDRMGFPLGWRYRPAEDFLPSQPSDDGGQWPPVAGNWGAWLLKLAGLVITAVAVAQGAPFWYDLLNRLVSLRRPAAGPAAVSPPALAAAAGAVASSVRAAVTSAIPLEIGHDLARAGAGFDPRKAYWLARAAALAYAPAAEVERMVKREWFFADMACWDIRRERADTQAFAFCDDDVAVVSFRGTEPKVLNDILTDVRFRQNPFSSDPALAGLGAVHGGFAGALDAVHGEMVAWLRTRWLGSARAGERVLYITGHSLGGALATLFAARLASDAAARDWRFQVYTFGCPLVGDRAFAAAFDRLTLGRVFRCVHGADAVTQVPPRALGFSHVGEMLHFTKPEGLRRDVTSLDRLIDLAVAGIDDLGQAARAAVEDHGCDFYVERCRQLAETAELVVPHGS